MMGCRCCKKECVLCVFGVLILAFAGSFLPLLNVVVRNMIAEDVVLKKGTFVYNAWEKPPFPIYFEFYVFDVVNPIEVTRDGDKPTLVEKGPYTYRLVSTNENVTFNRNGTVSYRTPSAYVFEREKSVGPETDTVTTANFILVATAFTLKNKYSAFERAMDLFLDLIKDNDLFLTLTVKDLIWGYEDPLLEKVKSILHFFHINYDDHFGFFYKMNGTDDGMYTVNTGSNNVQENFDVERWRGEKSLDFWWSDSCNAINGTDGNIFHPFMTEETVPQFFMSRLCRSMYFKFYDKRKVKGIPVNRYSLPAEVLQGPSNNSANRGFCNSTSLENCLPDGLYNASVCYKGSPFTISQPHFLFAAKEIQNSVGGLSPNVQQHQSFIDVLAEMGAVLRTEKSFQLNLHVTKMKEIKCLSEVSDVNLPVLWFKETTTLSDDWAHFLNDKYLAPMSISSYVAYVFIVVGAVIFIVSISICCRKRRKRTRELGTETEKLIKDHPSHVRGVNHVNGDIS